MLKNSKVAIIIPSRNINDYLKEAVSRVLELDRENFEILVLPDEKTEEIFPKTKIIPTGKVGPAEKRNLALDYTDAEILAFLDDDSYPDKDWLKNAINILTDEKIAAVCGPILTPPDDNLRQKVSGYVWSSWLGSGGAGTYRSRVFSKREIDDYPSVNFLVKRKDFEAVGGFNSRFWPGEDTKLCLDLTRKLGKKIIYDPKIIVWHHRRPVFNSHLAQIARYGLHRGYFARILPETSRRVGYFMPSLFVLGLIIGPFLIIFLNSTPLLFFYILAILTYLFLLLITAGNVYLREKNIGLALLLPPAILLTHLWYGFWFLRGFFSATPPGRVVKN